MPLVLGIATVLGLVGPIAAFGLFFLADRVFKLGHPQIQTMMYLMLSVAGHLTIFQTRTRGPWWSTRPAWILLAAVCGTQAAATLIAVYGAGLVTPLGWKYAGIVWGYAFAWFLVTDPLKLLTYKVLDTVKADEQKSAKAAPTPASVAPPAPADDASQSTPDASANPKPETKDMSPPENHAAAEPQGGKAPAPDANAKPKAAQAPEAKAPPDATPKAPPAPSAAAAKPEAPGASQADIGIMIKTMVGDLSRAGNLKDPVLAGHLAADAIIAAEKPCQPAETPKADAAATAPPPAMPKAAA